MAGPSQECVDADYDCQPDKNDNTDGYEKDVDDP